MPPYLIIIYNTTKMYLENRGVCNFCLLIFDVRWKSRLIFTPRLVYVLQPSPESPFVMSALNLPQCVAD